MTDRNAQSMTGDQKTTLATIAQAFQLSAHILVQDYEQLTGQLVGRLLGIKTPSIQYIIQQGISKKDTPWLRPLTPTLALPGGPLLRTITGHTDDVEGVAVTPDGTRAISASGGPGGDNTVRLWDLESGEELLTLRGHKKEVTAVAVTPDGQRAVSGSWDKTVRVWDLESGVQLRVLRGDTD